eukprot:CAMPEP_0182470514 /NCGR_PEP_ID=MMETSP1319-20130603/18835_1 /TAXON_ID=172717 /ORGANISM="Bolidomonas pacifica, Strain RCC208" /LENGTH=246 /DNA_ID=CAMNT_0024670967 /DNA_START=18 /DNA_END=754 /DNA_ORIENTATION=+
MNNYETKKTHIRPPVLSRSTSRSVLLRKRGVVYERLNSSNVTEALQMAVEVYPTTQAVSRVLGCGPADYLPSLRAYFLKCASESLSAVARKDGVVVGVALGVDLLDPSPVGVFPETDGMRILAEMRSELSNWYAASLPRAKGLMFYAKLGVVRPDTQRLGVGVTLAKLIVDLARESGFVMGVARATGNASGALFRSVLGFSDIASIEYETWERSDGTRPLEGLLNPKEASHYALLARSLVPGVWLG